MLSPEVNFGKKYLAPDNSYFLTIFSYLQNFKLEKFQKILEFYFLETHQKSRLFHFWNSGFPEDI